MDKKDSLVTTLSTFLNFVIFAHKYTITLSGLNVVISRNLANFAKFCPHKIFKIVIFAKTPRKMKEIW